MKGRAFTGHRAVALQHLPDPTPGPGLSVTQLFDQQTESSGVFLLK